ncbi:MAG: SLC13 family permease [Myxococcota bacterium]
MPRTGRKWVAFFAGLAAFAALAWLDTPLARSGEAGRPALAAGLTALMAIWWITEALPIHWSACVPLVVLPFSGIHGDGFGKNLRGALLPYTNPYIFLFLGGMGIAAAMQQWNLHRRIALGVMRTVGTDPRRLLFGLLLATASVSLWISNTATAAMMFPIGLAVIHEFERETERRLAYYGAALMLAIAYGANVGGIGTKIGTVPSAQLAGFLAQHGTELSFLEFMAIGVPFVVLFLPVAWLALWRLGRADAPGAEVGLAALARESARLGKMQRGERVVAAVFVAAAALWILGKPITEALRAQGFEGLRGAHVEATVSLLAVTVLLAVRVQGQRALAPGRLRTLQWPVLVLLGGGFSLAAAIEASGLSQWIGAQLAALRESSGWVQILAASYTTVSISAFASNTATVAVMLPVLASSVAAEYLDAVLFAAAFAASCDFALPAGTPPNAIVFGSGYVTIPMMVRTGVGLDAAAALLAAVWCGLAVPLLL